MGVAMLVFFARVLPWPNDLHVAVQSRRDHHRAHLVLASRSSPRSCARGSPRFNRELEEAAKDLGADEWRTFWDVLVPHMRPA